MPEPQSFDANSDLHGSPSSALSRNQGGSRLTSGIEVSSRLSLSRNLASYPFFDASSDLQRQEISHELLHSSWARKNCNRYRVVDCRQLQLAERQFLFDLQAIVGLPLSVVITEADEGLDSAPASMLKETSNGHSEELQSPAAGLPPDPTAEPAESNRESLAPPIFRTVSLVFNHEDHLRIDIDSRGECLEEHWRLASHIDDQFQSELDFAFHPTFGYLTACPAEAGTALRASVLVHLPATMAMGTHTDLSNRLNRWNVALREAFGDPSGGDFFRISNLATLGLTEAELLDQVKQAVGLAVQFEQEARAQWSQRDLPGLKREVHRALAELLTLDLQSKDDAVRWAMIRALSRMRLGLHLGLSSPAEGAVIASKFQLIWLKRLLDLAIAKEDYRAASRLRDRIKSLGESA
jgi:protein-arginine kinase